MSTPLSEQLRFIGQRDGRPGFDVTCLGFGAATISNHHEAVRRTSQHLTAVSISGRVRGADCWRLELAVGRA